MIVKIPADKRYLAAHGWLHTFHLFSFAEYYDPANMHFGMLRVFNDDTISGNSGFGAHQHDNMEIVTIVFEGELTHEDSMGNRGAIRAGDVQYMSAGTGVTHSERNLGNIPTHLYQIWLLPDAENLKPKYEQKRFSDMPKNELVALASGEMRGTTIAMHTPATIYMATVDAGKKVVHPLPSGRGAFLYLQSGTIALNGTAFGSGDQARITDEGALEIAASTDSRFILIDTVLV